MKSPTGRFNSGISSGDIFSTLVPKLKALRALSCRLKHIMLFASGTSMLKMAILKIARNNDRFGNIYYLCIHCFIFLSEGRSQLTLAELPTLPPALVQRRVQRVLQLLVVSPPPPILDMVLSRRLLPLVAHLEVGAPQ